MNGSTPGLPVHHQLPEFTQTHVHLKSLQSCPTLCDPIDGSPPGSSIHGIFQARVLEWGARGGSREELPHAPTPEARGGGREDQPHIQGAVAARAQEGLEELSHVEGQEGRLCPGATRWVAAE